MNSTKKISIGALFPILLLFILGISACRVGKDYQRPDLLIPDTYRSEIDSQDTLSLGDVHWRDFFMDTTLQKLIDTALLYNYDMQKALKNIEIADQQAMRARAEYLPEINADLATMSRQFRSKNFYSNPTAKYYTETGKTPRENMYLYNPQNTSSVNLSWELDIWGKIRRQNESTLAQYLQSHEARKLLQTELVASLAEGYYNLLMLDAQLEVARRNFELSDSTLRIVKLQRDAGQVTSLAIQQTEAQSLAARSLIPQIERKVAIQENTLRILTGQFPGGIERSLNLNHFMEDSVSAGVPLYVVNNRPDVKAAELALRAANANVGVAQAYRYPNLTIDATGGVNSMLVKNWVNVPGSLFGGLIGSVTQPIFNRRKLKTNIEIAKIEREKAELDFQESVLRAINEVTNTLVSLKKLREEDAIAKRRVEVAKLGVRQADLLFKAGHATYLEVINAQKNAIDSELELVGLQQQLLLARVELYRALGGGWQE